jgi:hypothetical protein
VIAVDLLVRGLGLGDVYISIENLRGGDFADTLTGNSVTNFLQGGPRGDALNGGDGFDFADYFTATSGVIVDLDNASNNTGEAGGDTFVSIEGIRGSAFDDVLHGDNVLNGGNATNQLIGGLGADTLEGAAFDYADYRDSTTGLTVSLANPGSNTGERHLHLSRALSAVIWPIHSSETMSAISSQAV